MTTETTRPLVCGIAAPAVVIWHSDLQQRTALLCTVGEKSSTLVYLNETNGFVLKRVLHTTYDNKGNAESIRLRLAVHEGEAYPVDRALQYYRNLERTWSIDDKAQAAMAFIAQAGTA